MRLEYRIIALCSLTVESWSIGSQKLSVVVEIVGFSYYRGRPLGREKRIKGDDKK
ncbi:hypothetical protein TNCV_1545851, partial [Trichonephila clavipes]